ncbi:MAG TPA: hypothetical protein VKK79_09150 [Candidatus Lokiarchaeia archaeon]|nr:hypothetical protein [Candidatus Lokiarchaeia archaeon]
MPSHWMTVAKAQLRIFSARVRRFRVEFFITVTAVLFLWAFIGAPAIVSSFIPSLLNLGNALRPVLGAYLDFIFLLVFAFFIIYPLQSSFQTMGEGQYELLVATPIKEGDIFLGEYLGKMPLYLWGILFLVPIIASLLQELFGISPVDVILITFVVFGLVALASWIGSIITGYVVKKLGKSSRGKDVGRALVVVLAMVFAFAYLGIYYIGESAIINPTFLVWLQISPSSWFANLVNVMIGVTLPLVGFGWELSLAAVLILSFVIFFGGYRLAPHFYSLDISSTQDSTSIITENGFFRFLRHVLPPNWKVVIVTQMKNFLRRKENVTRLAYMVIFVFLIFFISNFGSGSNSGGTNEAITTALILPWLFGFITGAQLGSFLFVNSKDTLWIFKQSPRDIKTLVMGSWISMILLVIPLALIIAIIGAIVAGMDFLQGVLFCGILILGGTGTLAIALGIGSMNPAYQRRSSKMTINLLIFAGTQVLVLIFGITVGIFSNLMADFVSSSSGFYMAALIAIVNCAGGIVIISLGILKLGKEE